MNYPVSTPQQLGPILVGMRKARGLTQTQVGQLLNVNQKRVARIEGAPGVTSFDQISRLVSFLGGRVVIEMKEAPAAQDAALRRANSPEKRKRHAGPVADVW
jgi:HTH-type transcriptional regulator/antitoxin HipB